MSTALGIASVTHVIKDLLNNGMIDNDVSNIIGTTIQVSSLPPSLVDQGTGATDTQLNLFLYRVSPNTGWNNIGLPSRNGRGDRMDNPPLALDLHYLLTAFGDQELHAEILLGYAMQLLHETPVLARDAIRFSLTASTPDIPATLPAHLQQLSTSELADQIELIKISPEAVNAEEISKLWTAFQTRYRPCTAYVASVVLIESKKSTRSSLPVQERNFYPLPFKKPTIEKVLSQATPPDPILENQRVLVEYRLYLRGHSLKGDPLHLLVNGEAFPVNQSDVSDTEVSWELPNTLKAGLQGVQVVHSLELGAPPPKKVFESNLVSFVLSPEITGAVVLNPVNTSANLFSATIVVSVSPEVHPHQRATLLLNQTGLPPGTDPASYSFKLPAAFWDANNTPVLQLPFEVQEVQQGNYLVRLQIDGAESPLDTDNITGEYIGPQISVP